MVTMLALLAAALTLCAGCTYTDGGEDTAEATSPPPDPRALTTREDPSPKYVSKAKVGSDMRYILSYRGRAVHIFAGESGLLGVKIIADRGETTWDSLWLTFSPRRVRPREHNKNELPPEGEVNLDFVPEDLRGYVQDAQQLALHLAPQAPRTGEEAVSPPEVRAVISEVALPPVAANELAIFARTGKLVITKNLKIPARDIPSALNSKGYIRFNECVSNVSYVPTGAWATFKLMVRDRHTIYYVLRDQSGAYTAYAESYDHVPGRREKIVLDQLITNNGGILSANYYEPVSDDPMVISLQTRKMAGIAMSILDGGVLEPPEDFKHKLVVFTSLLTEREQVNDFNVVREGPRGVEPILQEFESGN